MLTELQKLLNTLASVGIEEAAIETSPENEGMTLVRGASKSNVVVFHEIDGEFFDAPVGIQTVRGLLARIDLFDVTKATVSSSGADGKFITDLTLKQGRRSASFRCADPTRLTIPKRVPSNIGLDERIVLPGEYVANITTAIAAMAMTGSKADRTISLTLKDGILTTTIFDGEDDSFTDELVIDGAEDLANFTSSWDVPSFQLVMKESKAANGGNAVFAVTEHKIAVFNIGMVNVLVIPSK